MRSGARDLLMCKLLVIRFRRSETEKLEEGTFGINSAQRQCCRISQNDVKAAKVVDVSMYMQSRLVSATWTIDFVQQKGRRKFELDGEIVLL